MRARNRKLAISTVVLLIALPACGGGSSTTTTAPPAASTTSGATTAAPTTQATTTAPPTTQPSTTAGSTTSAPTTSAGTGDAELIAAGKVLFDTTAGGVGCAVCHGADALGNEELASPAIRGVDFMTIANALVERAQMTTLVLSDNDIKAVVAYLATFDPNE